MDEVLQAIEEFRMSIDQACSILVSRVQAVFNAGGVVSDQDIASDDDFVEVNVEADEADETE